MPEEHNRVLTDHAADLLLAPTQVAMGHLTREGLANRARLVGDVMTDVCYLVRDAVTDSPTKLPAGIDPAAPYVVATIHRADNTDDPRRLETIAAALATIPVPVALLAHPRLRARAAEHGIDLARGTVRVSDPLPYPALVRAVLGSAGVVTDSGGLQKRLPAGCALHHRPHRDGVDRDAGRRLERSGRGPRRPGHFGRQVDTGQRPWMPLR
jgi:UDP-N-acetylglucosamine 2-epimerase (non-hydrolysing)